MLIGDFNLTINNKRIQNVMTTFDLECLIKKPTCFQSSNPTCVDLIKGNAKTKLYRDCDSFIIDHFKKDFDNNLKNDSITEYSHFRNVFLEILHKHAPIKKNILRFNDNRFMTKALRKARMHRLKLKNIFHKTKPKEDCNN